MKQLFERERELAAIEALRERGSGFLIVEGGAGLGKTSLLEESCQRAQSLGWEILRARGSELEAGFAFGLVRQLFERRLANADAAERDALLTGAAKAVQPLVTGLPHESAPSPEDTAFAVLHGLYWLTANLSTRKSLFLAVDDAHWSDEPSLRWLVYLARRLEGLAVAMLVTVRTGEAVRAGGSLLALRAEAPAVVRLELLSESAARAVVHGMTGGSASNELCRAAWRASGGNPLYLTELLRAIEFDERRLPECEPGKLLVAGRGEIAGLVIGRVGGLNSRALCLAQALAILGDGCQLRLAAMVAGMEMTEAKRLAAGLVRREVLSGDDPPGFIHPVVREAIEASLASDEREQAHHRTAQLLHAEGAQAGQIASHLLGVRPAGDSWVMERLTDAARVALTSGAPQAAVALLSRALDEPPPPELRVRVLRDLARAEASAGRETACSHLEEALRLTADAHQRAQVELEIAEVYAALFRWADAVDVIEKALADLDESDETLATRLEGELVVCALHDARRASRAGPALRRLSSRPLAGRPAEAFAVARGMALVLAGGPAKEAAYHLEEALARAGGTVENWDTRAALLWSLVVTERFAAVEAALAPMVADVERSGSARGLIAAYTTLGLLKLRLGALPEADSAARVALRVLQEGDFQPGFAFAATVIADVAIEAGDLNEAEAVLALIPQKDWPAGVGSVLIPAARGRLRLAQGRMMEAVADFQMCAEMFKPEIWGMDLRDVGYLHARAGAALAWLKMGERQRASELAEAELADVRAFGAPRALGISLRIAGLSHGGVRGIELLSESVSILRESPALLERAHSLAELGAALHRAGRRSAAREPLTEALDLAARCGARPLAARAREELKATGARPRREWRTGLEALTPGELRVVQLAAQGHSNRDIACQLYVTLKTVEGHLSRAYTKLGISSRSQLSTFLESEK